MTPGEKALWVKMKQGKKTEGCQGKMDAGHFDRRAQKSGEICPVILEDT